MAGMVRRKAMRKGTRSYFSLLAGVWAMNQDEGEERSGWRKQVKCL